MEQQIRDIIGTAIVVEGNGSEGADLAAHAVMQLVRPYITALEELAPIEAEALDAKRLGALAGQATLDVQ